MGFHGYFVCVHDYIGRSQDHIDSFHGNITFIILIVFMVSSSVCMLTFISFWITFAVLIVTLALTKVTLGFTIVALVLIMNAVIALVVILVILDLLSLQYPSTAIECGHGYIVCAYMLHLICSYVHLFIWYHWLCHTGRI